MGLNLIYPTQVIQGLKTVLRTGESGYDHEIQRKNTLTLDSFQLGRELRLLMAIQGLYLKIILTLDDDPELQYNGTRRINARDCSLD